MAEGSQPLARKMNGPRPRDASQAAHPPHGTPPCRRRHQSHPSRISRATYGTATWQVAVPILNKNVGIRETRSGGANDTHSLQFAIEQTASGRDGPGEKFANGTLLPK